MSSRPIDEKIAKLSLDSSQFEKNATNAIRTFRDMNKTFSKSSSVDLSNLEKSVDSISGRFTLLGNIGQAAFQRIANTVLNLAAQLNNIFGLGGAIAGFAEYELKLGSIQTIMVNTGESIESVSQALNELNEYADQTIYSFSDMTRNIGLFTAAGVDLATSVSSIKGLANLAAGMGVSNEAAARATWQLSQALGTGYVRLQDWMSVENAGLGGEYFQKALVEHANAIGALSLSYDELKEKYGSFRNSLTEGAWLTNDVLAATLADFANDATLQDAATKVKSFSQLVDTVRESVGSGWAQTWEILFGNLEEAKSFWSPIADEITGFVNRSSDARNQFLQEWKDLGGLEATINGFSNIFKGLGNIISSVKDAFKDFLPDITPEKLAEFAKSFEAVTEDFSNFKPNLDFIVDGFNKLKDIGSQLADVFSGLKGVLNFENLFKVGSLAALFAYFKGKNAIPKAIESLTKAVKETPKELLNNVIEPLEKLSGLITAGKLALTAGTLVSLGYAIKSFAESIQILSSIDIASIGKSIASILILIASVSLIMKLLPGEENVLAAFGITALADAMQRLAPAIETMSKINIVDLSKTVVALGIILTELVVAMKFADGNILKATSFIGLAVALDALTVAFKILESMDPIKMLQIVGVLGLVLTELVAATNLLDHSMMGAASMIGIAAALDILAVGLMALSLIPANSLLQTVTILGVILTELVVATNNLNHSMMGGASMMMVAASIDLIAAALMGLSLIPVDSLLTAISGMAVALGLLVTAVNSVGHSMMGGATMVMIATSLDILAVGLMALSTIDGNKLLTSCIAIGIALTELTTAVNFLNHAIMGGVTLVLMASALTILSSAMVQLGSLNLSQIGVAVTAMASALVVLIGAAYLAKGASVGLLTLAGAFVTFGAAAVGIGILIESIADAITKLNGVGIDIDFEGLFGGIVEGIKAVIPSVGEAIFTGFMQIITQLTEKLPVLVDGLVNLFVTLLQSLSDAVVNYGPQLSEAFVQLLTALGTLLLQTVQSLITNLITWVQEGGLAQLLQLGVDLIMALVNGILSFAGQLITAGWTAVTNFISGIGSWIGQVWNKGVEVVTNFISGIGSWISNLFSSGVEAVQNFISGIGNMLQSVFDKGAELITSFIDGIKSFFGDLFGSGEDSAEEAKRGMELVDASSSGQNFVQGFINGMSSLKDAVGSVASSIGGIASNALNAVLSIFSPSRETFASGEFFDEGFINGIRSMYSKVRSVASGAGEMAMEGLNMTTSDIANQQFDMQPRITPIVDSSKLDALSNFRQQLDLTALLRDKTRQNGSEKDSKLLQLLQAYNNKMDQFMDKLEDIKLYLHINGFEVDGETLTDVIDEVHTIRDLLDKTGKGE